MASALVERATSDVLIGPDWSMNVEICDILNNEASQAKDIIKCLKKRIANKNPKVQLLALTLLETVVKNCGDIAHGHVAEKDIPHEMVKIVKKKPDFHVKEKILILIDTWQEAFGGPRAKYPQYYAAYHELLRAGAVFPQKSESSAPIFTPPQTKPLTSYQQPHRNLDIQPDVPGPSASSDVPTLSFADIQNARGIMDVLDEMLNALDPANKQGLNQEVIVDLVEQCRINKRRLVQLVNTTSDEDLLSKGLSLNDDLERVLAKRDAIAAGVYIKAEKLTSVRSSVDVGSANSKSGGVITHANVRSITGTGTQTPTKKLVSAPSSIGSIPPRASSNIDLLTGDLSVPVVDNSLALVPVSEPLSASDQNVLALSDMFDQHDSIGSNHFGPSNRQILNAESTSQTYPAPTEFNNRQLTESSFLSSSGALNSDVAQYQQSFYGQGSQPNYSNMLQNGEASQSWIPQQPPNLGYSDQHGGAFPLPPWEIQQVNDKILGREQQLQGTQLGGTYLQPIQMSQIPAQQPTGTQLYPLPGGLTANTNFQQPTQTPIGGYTYLQQPHAQYYDQSGSAYPYVIPYELSQRMHGIHMQDTNRSAPYQMPTSSLQQSQPMKPARPEDKLFGDLVNIAKSKYTKTPTST